MSRAEGALSKFTGSALALVLLIGLTACGGPPNWVKKGSGAFNEKSDKSFYGVGSVVGVRNEPLAWDTAENRSRAEIAKEDGELAGADEEGLGGGAIGYLRTVLAYEGYGVFRRKPVSETRQDRSKIRLAEGGESGLARGREVLDGGRPGRRRRSRSGGRARNRGLGQRDRADEEQSEGRGWPIRPQHRFPPP